MPSRKKSHIFGKYSTYPGIPSQIQNITGYIFKIQKKKEQNEGLARYLEVNTAAAKPQESM